MTDDSMPIDWGAFRDNDELIALTNGEVVSKMTYAQKTFELGREGVPAGDPFALVLHMQSIGFCLRAKEVRSVIGLGRDGKRSRRGRPGRNIDTPDIVDPTDETRRISFRELVTKLATGWNNQYPPMNGHQICTWLKVSGIGFSTATVYSIVNEALEQAPDIKRGHPPYLTSDITQVTPIEADPFDLDDEEDDDDDQDS